MHRKFKTESLSHPANVIGESPVLIVIRDGSQTGVVTLVFLEAGITHTWLRPGANARNVRTQARVFLFLTYKEVNIVHFVHHLRGTTCYDSKGHMQTWGGRMYDFGRLNRTSGSNSFIYGVSRNNRMRNLSSGLNEQSDYSKSSTLHGWLIWHC